MENYNPNISSGTHLVKITIQQWDFVGHIFKLISANIKGRSVLEFDFYCEDGSFLESDCNLSFYEDLQCFSAILKNKSGNTLAVRGNSGEFNNMIVAVEILDFRR